MTQPFGPAPRQGWSPTLASGAFCHQASPAQGMVPHLLGWECRFPRLELLPPVLFGAALASFHEDGLL